MLNMTEQEYQQLYEASLRRKLRPEEEMRLQAWFLAHPQAQADWEEQMNLNHLLGQLPSQAASSNFTSQVLLALDREERMAQPVPARGWREWLRLHWLRPATVAALLISSGVLSIHQYRAHSRTVLAKDLSTLTSVAKVPSVQVLQDFEAIRRLSSPSIFVDEDLLTLSRQ
jgi:hypothetical protein